MANTRALDILKANGYKITDKRKSLLDCFPDDEQYVSPTELISHLQKKYSGMSYDTVYRNLETFQDLGILEETEYNGEKKFKLSCGTAVHHHHLICLGCNKTVRLDSCPMNLVPETAGFKVTGHKFEIYGYCEACQQG